MELKSGISTFCPHCDEPFTMYPFGQEVIDSTELAALRQRIEADEVSYKLMTEERRQALASLANAANEAEALRQRVAELEADNQRLLNCYTHYKRALGDVAKITTQDYFVGRLVYLALVNEPKE